VETITPDMLVRVWQELDYRLDMCRLAKGAQWNMYHKLVQPFFLLLLVFIILFFFHIIMYI
jgi:hypothetical protein